MEAVYILLAIITAVVIIGAAWVFNRSYALDERQSELDKYSVHLDERDNRIAADEQTIRGEWESLRKAHNEIIGKKADKTTTPTE